MEELVKMDLLELLEQKVQRVLMGLQVHFYIPIFLRVCEGPLVQIPLSQ